MTSFFRSGKILVASNNQGKLRELTNLLREAGIHEVINSEAYQKLEEPEEIGQNFQENAIIKAKYYGSKTNLIALADDSGLSIELLNNLPGIYSARFATLPGSTKKDYNYAFAKIQKELLAIDNTILSKKSAIKAFFTCSLAIYNPATDLCYTFSGQVHGHLAFPPRGFNGFGYDPIFIPLGFLQTFGEMDTKDKEKINHRYLAFQKLIKANL